ncbi:MAG: VWA domain-containing protein, partial [Bryobacteraceae bacterium]
PTALMAIGPSGLTMLQDFNQSNEKLKEKLHHLAAFDPNPKGGVDPHWVPEHAQSALRALMQVARTAVGSPYSLNVIWVTSGFPGLIYRPGTEGGGVEAGLRRVINLLMDTRMRLYTIDPIGVIPLGELASNPKISRGHIQDGHVSAAEQMLASTGGEESSTRSLLDHMTKMMGGVSYYGRNDVEEALSEAMTDGSSAYLLSYSPSNTTFDGSYRKIEVHTDVPDSAARTRQGYYAVPDDTKPDKDMTNSVLEAALSSPLLYVGLQVACPASYDAATNRLTGKVVVTPYEQPAEPDQHDQTIRAASFSDDNKLLNSWLWRVSWKAPWTTRVVSASVDKVLSPKSKFVRFLVADPSAQRIGTCEYRLP